ncbi:MAG TPA: phage portal protein [Chloroflexia bacterium]
MSKSPWFFGDVVKKPATMARKEAAFPIMDVAAGLVATFNQISTANLITYGYKQCALVFACFRAIADAFAQAPLRVYTRKGDEIPDHPLRRLFENPNPIMGEAELWKYLIVYGGFGGNGFLHMVPTNRINPGQSLPQPGEVWPYHIGKIEPIPLGNRWVDHYDFLHSTGARQRIEAEDVAHWKWAVDPEYPFRGLSPLVPASKQIDTLHELLRYTKAILQNDAVTRGILHVPAEMPLTKRQKDELRQDWQRQYGEENRGIVGLLEGGMTYERIALNFEELAAEELRAGLETDVCMAIGVHPSVVAALVGLKHATYSNFEEANRAFHMQLIVPMWGSVAAEVQSSIVPRFGGDVLVRFDTSKVDALHESTDAKWKRVISAGRYLTLNEVRQELGKSPIPGGDVILPDPSPGGSFGGGDVGVGSPTKKDLDVLATKAAGSKKKESIEANIADDLEAHLTGVYKRVATRAGKEDKASADLLDDEDWDADADDVEELMQPHYEGLFGIAYTDANKLLPVDVSFDQKNKLVQKAIGKLGTKVRGVADTTRDEIRRLASKATDEGWSPQELAKQLRGLADLAPESDSKVDKSRARSRSEMIARTETTTAYNLGGTYAYEEAGVKEVDVLDGDGDDECASANGQRWTLEKARDNPIAHPGCTRVLKPVIEG